MTEKPDYLTGYMMLKDILPELSKRINLGADKYEPDDWKTRPPKYFWAKLHRHMKDAVEDWDALDEDDLPHLTAMWFHITALVWKREYGKPETTGHMGSDDPEEATEPTEDRHNGLHNAESLLKLGELTCQCLRQLQRLIRY